MTFPQISVEGLEDAIALPFSTSALKQVRKVADSRSKNLSLGMEYDSDEYSSDEDDLDLFDFMEEAGQTLKANAAAVGEKAAVKKTDVVQNSTELDVSSEVI